MKLLTIPAIALMAMLMSVTCSSNSSSGNNNTVPVHTDDCRTIKSFSYRLNVARSMYGSKRYGVKWTDDGKVLVTIDQGSPLWGTVEADHAVIDSLQQIVERYKMYKYKKEYRPFGDVRDGESWDLHIGFADGTTVSSSGENAWPKQGGDAFDAVMSVLDVYRILLWEGTYASTPKDYKEYKEYENSYFDDSPWTMTVGPAQSDSTCTVTVTAKGKYTLQCKGKINKYNDMAIYLEDNVLSSDKPFDPSKPLFQVDKMLNLHDSQQLGLFGEYTSLSLAKLKK